MNRTSRKTQPGWRWVCFGLFAFTMSLLAISSLPATAQKGAPAGWRVEMQEGQKRPSSLSIRNTCKGPHRFRVQSKIKYLSFGESTADILVAAAATREIKALFDATGLKSKTYHDKVIVECLDCKKEKTCHQDRDELAVEMIVTKPVKIPGSFQQDVSATHPSKEQLQRVTSNEKFKAALDVVASQNEAVDLKNARLLTSPGAPDLSAIQFGVTVKGTKKPGEYASLVYMEQTGMPPIVFFDGKQPRFLPYPGPARGNGRTGGGPPPCIGASTTWLVVGTFCQRSICGPFPVPVKARFQVEVSSSICPGSNISRTRIVVADCKC